MIQQYIDKYVEVGILPSYIEMWAQIKENGSIESEKGAIIGQLYGGSDVSLHGEALGGVDGRGAPVGGDKLSLVQGRVTGRSHSGRAIHTDPTAFSAKGPSTRSAG
jgi:hypothetical protein